MGAALRRRSGTHKEAASVDPTRPAVSRDKPRAMPPRSFPTSREASVVLASGAPRRPVRSLGARHGPRPSPRIGSPPTARGRAGPPSPHRRARVPRWRSTRVRRKSGAATRLRPRRSSPLALETVAGCCAIHMSLASTGHSAVQLFCVF